MDTLIIDYLLEEGILLKPYRSTITKEDYNKEVQHQSSLIKKSFQKVFTVIDLYNTYVSLEAKDGSILISYYSTKKNRPIIGKEYLALFTADEILHLQLLDRDETRSKR